MPDYEEPEVTIETRYILKRWAKLLRWQWRRFSAGLRWGFAAQKRLPAVLAVAIPKSGSHLIIQVLEGLAQLGPFANPGMPPVNRFEDNQKLPQSEVVQNITRMQPGDIGYGYMGAVEPYRTLLTAPGRATIFIYRDPRDLIISQVFYATEIHKQHWMHRYYTEVLHSMEERINAAILGVRQPGSELPSIRQRFESYLGWLEEPAVFSVRFEDLILERQQALNRLLDYLEAKGFAPRVSRAECIRVLTESIEPKRSGTFRKGKPGNWREHFTPANITTFKEQAGDLLVRLGYEQDHSW